LMAGRSISFRLTAWFSAVLFTGLLLFGVAMWYDLHHTLSVARSRTLTRRADRLSELLLAIQFLPADEGYLKFKEFAKATGGGLIDVFTSEGTQLFPPKKPAAAFPWPGISGLEAERYQTVSFEDEDYYVLMRPFSIGQKQFVLCLAAPLAGNQRVLRTFSSGLLLAIPLVLVFSALGGYLLSRRALSPVDRITATARTISASNLSQRIPVVHTGDELQRLTDTCNSMLAQLEVAVNEIKQFTADASHELRAPLSLIRISAELGITKAQADAESRQAFRQIVDACSRATRLVEDLLILARSDAGTVPAIWEPLDLVDLVAVVCDESRSLIQARGLRMVIALDDKMSALVWGDYSGLRRLFWILIENAAKYTPAPGLITVSVSGGAGTLSVSVEDNGIGISETNLQQLGRRFFRADRSRGEVEGFGLGLAIARTIIKAHRAELEIKSREGEGSVFSVTFPAFEAGRRLESPTCMLPAACASVEGM
jgi:signal transduction histidine kinase